MKKMILFAMLAIILAACNNSKKDSPDASDPSGEQVTGENTSIPVYELDSLLQVADQKIDQKVKVCGYVTHTCKHSGKRCFITGEDQKVSMRVEAKGNIGGFNRELVGSKLEITGVVKERRLTKEYIAQMEEDTKEKQQKKEDGSAESCAAEIKNINEMKSWMKEKGKDYYSIYYMDGEDYEVIN